MAIKQEKDQSATKFVTTSPWQMMGLTRFSPCILLSIRTMNLPIMRNLLILLLALGNHALGNDWVVIEGSISPDKKYSVAVFPQKTEFIDEADDTVLLIDHAGNKSIGPLKDVTSSGGTWGKTTENVHCVWSADSSLMIVNFRVGRLMHDSKIYRINENRAIPLELPDPKTHAKGKVLEEVEYNANPSIEIKLGENGTILKTMWSIMPKAGVDYSKYGLAKIEGALLFHYRFNKEYKLELVDVTVAE